MRGGEPGSGSGRVTRRTPRAVRITDAPPSPAEERRHREIRYGAMMGIRVLCLILVTILVEVHAPYLGIWVPVLVVGVLVIPWLAVILANDRLSKRSRHGTARPRGDVPARILTQGQSDAEAHPIIDVDP